MKVKGETCCLRSLKNHFSIPIQFLMKKKSPQENFFVDFKVLVIVCLLDDKFLKATFKS